MCVCVCVCVSHLNYQSQKIMYMYDIHNAVRMLLSVMFLAFYPLLSVSVGMHNILEMNNCCTIVTNSCII